jgi:hypothetical protein
MSKQLGTLGVLWLALALPLLAGPPRPGKWVDLFNGKNLDGWEAIGDGVWMVLRDGTLLGQCDPKKPCLHQAWLYSKREFGEFDLRLDYWTRLGGNSGVSIRDSSRGRWAVGQEYVSSRTPSHIGYEIQIGATEGKSYEVSGSVYLFAPAKGGVQRSSDWNTLEIESRKELIRVRLNGVPVSEFPGAPERPAAGPIGLQLHDRNTVIMFRQIRIREYRAK